MHDDDSTLAGRLIAQMRRAMFRKEREHLGYFLVLWAIVALAAAAPAALAIVLHDMLVQAATEAASAICALPGKCAAIAAAATDPPTEPELAGSLYGAKVAFLGALALLWALGLSVLWAQFRIARRYWEASLDDRCSGARYGLIGPGIGARILLQLVIFGAVFAALYLLGALTHPAGGGIWLWAAMTALTAWAVAAAFVLAPPDLACRDKTDLRSDLRNAPRLILPGTIAVGLVCGYAATHALGLDQEMWVGLIDTPHFWAFAVSATVALIFTAAVATGLATYSYAWDYPSQRQARRILDDVVDYSHGAAGIAGELWDMMESHVGRAIRDGEDDELPPDEAQALFQPMPCMSRMTAASCDTLIRLMAMPLAAVLVTGLVALHLGLAALSGAQGAGVAETPLVAGGLLIWIGVALTLSFALLFVWPLVHLGTFKSTSEAPRPEKPGGWFLRLVSPPVANPPAAPASPPDAPEPVPVQWTVGEISRQSDAALKKAREESRKEQPPPLDPASSELIVLHKRPGMGPLKRRILRLHIGADKAKFTAILKSQQFGGVFQELLGKTARGKLVSVLTVLAPALTSTLIELIK